MNSLKKVSSILSVFALIFAFSVNSAVAQDGNVVDVINESENHTIFAELLAETNLDDAIADQGPFTIIAPNDEAFEAMGDELEQIKADPDMLQNLLIGHLFQGENSAEDVEPALGVNITTGDIPASNGLVHVTDEVLN